MSGQVDGSWSFRVASGETRYPLKTDPSGTTTAGSSDFITARGIVLDSIVVKDGGSAAGTLTISDHAGTAGTSIVVALFTTDGVPDITFGPYGIKVPWTGIRATLTGTAAIVRVIFRNLDA